jgi:hypothetical protein
MGGSWTNLFRASAVGFGAVDAPWAQTYGAAVKQALRLIRWGTMAGLGALVIGLAVFFVYALTEVLAHPGLSLVDGYWIGRLPWTGIGEGLTVIGATVAVAFGTVTVWLGGNRWTRALVLVPLAVAGSFWFAATLPPPGGAPCTDCTAQVADPFAFAYSLPVLTVIMLLLPAVTIAVLAFTSRPGHARHVGESAV